ncbi:agglutinin-like protein [Wolffia australiana]
MFDWNEDEEVRDTIWGVLNETEDHIVPYPKESDEEYSKKQRHEASSASNLIVTSGRAKSGSNNDFPGSSSLEGTSNFDPNEQISASRFDMDTWPDLPSLNSSFGKGFIGDCARSNPIANTPDTMVNSLYHSGAAIVENKDSSLKDHCGEPGNSFLDCDWGNIADFDDFDRIFRNDDSLFGSDIISHGGDEILSHSTNANNSSTPSFTLQDSNSERGSPAKEVEGQQVNALDGENVSAIAPTQLLDNYGKRDHSSDGVERLKRSSKSRKRAEEKGPSGIHQFKPPGVSFHQRDDGGQPFMGNYAGASKLLGPPYEYPVRPFSPASTKHPLMTPQEKIEKLRRRQQMQAMLAIQQQQQQIEQKSSSTEMSATQVSPRPNQGVFGDDAKMIPSSDVALPTEADDLQNSVLIDDSLGEKIFYQLQDAISKLEVNVRLCIRDSLLRLGKSAVERNNASDRNSIIKSSRDDDEAPTDEDKKICETLAKPHAETDTNPIDRIVAHLLFHCPSSEPTPRLVKEELPLPPPLPLMNFPASKEANPEDDFSDQMLHTDHP